MSKQRQTVIYHKPDGTSSPVEFDNATQANAAIQKAVEMDDNISFTHLTWINPLQKSSERIQLKLDKERSLKKTHDFFFTPQAKK